MNDMNELKETLRRIAEQIRAIAPAAGDLKGGGGSLHRALPEDLRKAFVTARATLFQRGIYDPVLVRFDTATVAQASNAEIADELTKVAEAL